METWNCIASSALASNHKYGTIFCMGVRRVIVSRMNSGQWYSLNATEEIPKGPHPRPPLTGEGNCFTCPGMDQWEQYVQCVPSPVRGGRGWGRYSERRSLCCFKLYHYRIPLRLI